MNNNLMNFLNIFKNNKKDTPKYTITGRGVIHVKSSDILKTKKAQDTLKVIKEIKLDTDR